MNILLSRKKNSCPLDKKLRIKITYPQQCLKGM